MIYQEKIISHNKKETGGFPFKEAVVNIEFSQGDLIELRKILKKTTDSEWCKSLLLDIETTLTKADFNINHYERCKFDDRNRYLLCMCELETSSFQLEDGTICCCKCEKEKL